MPSTRRSAITSSDAIEAEPDDQEGGVALTFNEPLSWKAGKPISVSVLLQRLGALLKELNGLEQEEAKRSSLLPVAQSLAGNILSHNDRGVKAWAACCIVEMFRLCAPDAPYSGSQLKTIFNLLIGQLIPALVDPTNPYNSQHLFVLKSLAEVKSIVLVTDIPSSSKLVEQLFETCFDVLSQPSKSSAGEQLSKNVEHHMTAILSTLVDESQSLSGDVLGVVLAQFLRADPDTIGGSAAKAKKLKNVDDRQSTLILREAPPAYNMAKNVCNTCPDKMARYISHYFSQVVADTAVPDSPDEKHSRSSKTKHSIPDLDDEPAGDDNDQNIKAHKLIKELWRSAPGVLVDVVPQLEMELSAENVNLRILAAETLGDMASGVGAGGPPTNPKLDPSAYPSQSVTSISEQDSSYDFLTTPNSPISFPARYPQVFESLLSRRNDRSPLVRSACVTSIGRIIATSAGGVGLDPEDEKRLLSRFAEMLVDNDEKVRVAAIKAIEQLSFDTIIQRIGNSGGVADKNSVLSNLADRVKDRKPPVRIEAIKLMAKLWGVAVGAISEGSERVNNLLGPIPSRIFEAYYLNEKTTNVLVESVLYESLLPLGYPQIKSKSANGGKAASRRSRQSQGNGDLSSINADPDRLRTERILLLIKGLEPKAKTVFFAKLAGQPAAAKFMEAFLQRCEAYNGGVMDDGEAETKSQLGMLIDHFITLLPEPVRASDDLWKYAENHDRRSYQLIRFCMAPGSDYKKAYRALKEFVSRIQEASSPSSTLLNTILPLVYGVSLLIYNRDHVPAVIEFSRTDEKGLGVTAHELINEISSHNPEIFKANVQDLCKALEADAPTSKQPNSETAVDNLKACASFARSAPKDMPKDRKFLQALISYCVHGTPPKAAKYAVSVLMRCSDKKTLHAKEVLKQCSSGLKRGSENWVARLAALSELIILGVPELEYENFIPIVKIAVDEVLDKKSSDNAEDDQESSANYWAMKILVNSLRSTDGDEEIAERAAPVFRRLNGIVADDSSPPRGHESADIAHATLRLHAAQNLLKLSTSKRLESLLSHKSFNQLVAVAQYRHPHSFVRQGFTTKIMKYLGQERISRRFYALIFTLAWEPEPKIKDNAHKWLQARSAAFTKANDTSMETLFARFISLLAHHPDFDRDVDNLKDFVQYILFYLTAVASQKNLSLIYHVAQRVKTVRDGIDDSASDNLYCLSDLSQAVIRCFADVRGWSMQAFPGKHKMPGGIYAALPSHTISQKIATTQYVPAELMENLDDLVRSRLRTSKRKFDANGEKSSKRQRSSANVSKIGKSSKKSSGRHKSSKSRKDRSSDGHVPDSERRRSGRNTEQKQYLESDDSEAAEDDEDMSDESDY